MTAPSLGWLLQELNFRRWYAKHAENLGLDADPDNPMHFYDWRQAYRAGATPDKQGHWPSTYKLLGHSNLIVDGRDTRTGKPASKHLAAQSAMEYIKVETAIKLSGVGSYGR